MDGEFLRGGGAVEKREGGVAVQLDVHGEDGAAGTVFPRPVRGEGGVAALRSGTSTVLDVPATGQSVPVEDEAQASAHHEIDVGSGDTVPPPLVVDLPGFEDRLDRFPDVAVLDPGGEWVAVLPLGRLDPNGPGAVQGS